MISEEKNSQNSISVVLINYNSWEDTVECVKSLFNSDFKNFSVVIVDNKSTNNSTKKLEECFNEKFKKIFISFDYDDNFSSNDYSNKKIFLIKNKDNVGFSKGNNIGIKFNKEILNNKYIWILNNDVEVDKNAMKYLVDYSNDDLDKNFLGVTIIEYYNRELIQCTCGGRYCRFTTMSKNSNKGVNIKELDKLRDKSNYISGCSIFGSKDLFEKVGNFSTDYFLYFEEMDLMIKSKKNKIGKKWVKNAIIFHKEGASIGSKNLKRKKSEFSEYQSNISCLIFNKKHYRIMWQFYILNRYILKRLKFFIEKTPEYVKSLNKAYSDFKGENYK